MGYYIRFLPKKRNPPVWKVQFVSYKRADQKEPIAAGHKRAWDISKIRWRALGFHPTMTLLEAKTRASQLNAQLKLKRQEEQLKEIQEKQNAFHLRNKAMLPEEFVAEFEARFIRARTVLSNPQRQKLSRRRYTTWRAAQKVIAKAGLEPTNWFYQQEVFYDIFCENQFSPGYIQSILAIMNLWGYYITRKLAQPFSPLRRPRGYESQRIIQAYYQKTGVRRLPSKPITPQHLVQINGKINIKNFNWLYISVWFGLRPQEIDQLTDEAMWKLEILPTGRKILWVFQTKIIALPPEDRWKPIPIIFDEQRFALKMITDKNLKRPLTKTIHKHIGHGHDTYGGRKGFVDLMLSKGQSLENISIWMGHSTLSRTWRSYKNKRAYHW